MSLNPVKPHIYIDGKEIAFESLRLEQGMNSCHSFDVVQEYMSQDELWMSSPQKLVEQVGSRIKILFQQKNAQCAFFGWVTDVCIDSWNTNPSRAEYGHQSNRIHILGHGDVIRMERAKGMDSYLNQTLNDIVSNCASTFSIPVVCNPKYTNVLPYVMRYNESVFQFLNRLSSTFGELFYYDGEKLCFGSPDDSATTNLTLGLDLINFRTFASSAPLDFERYDFLPSDGEPVFSGSSQPDPKQLMQNVARRNNLIYSEKDYTHCEYPIERRGQMDSILSARRSSAIGSLLNMEGVTCSCALKLGGKVEISVPTPQGTSNLGIYRIMDIVHQVDKTGNYSNHFKATPVGMEQVSTEYYQSVKAYPEIATVLSNADPQGIGRVQVQFDWQKRRCQNTNWIRVQSPDAGQGIAKNRGVVFVPEEGDRVMVGFEYGDPNRPFVMGSMFDGTNGEGGGSDNAIHSIITKSGHKIIFNDNKNESWSIAISDEGGNLIRLDSAGQNIFLKAKGSIALEASNISFDASESITMQGQERVDIYGNNGISVCTNDSIEVTAKESVTLSDKNLSISTTEDEIHNSDKLTLSSKSEIDINSEKIGIDSTKDNLELKSGGDIDAQSKGKVNLY